MSVTCELCAYVGFCCGVGGCPVLGQQQKQQPLTRINSHSIRCWLCSMSVQTSSLQLVVSDTLEWNRKGPQRSLSLECGIFSWAYKLPTDIRLHPWTGCPFPMSPTEERAFLRTTQKAYVSANTALVVTVAVICSPHEQSEMWCSALWMSAEATLLVRVYPKMHFLGIKIQATINNQV